MRPELTHTAGPGCCPPRDVGWVFHSVAVHVADRAARQTGERHRVRAGRDGGWVAELAPEPVEVSEPCS